MLKCGLIGAKLGHSFSPQIHKKLTGAYTYDLFEMPENEVGDFVRSNKFDAINVTIPYKKTVMPFLDEISHEALRIGSVNTITHLPDGRLRGDNTDYYGFRYTVVRAGIEIKDKKVLVLGSGGASMTARTVAADMGAKEVVIISRSGENNYENITIHSDADIIINTTPVGMYPNTGVSPVDLTVFKKLSGVLDMIYNPSKTALLLQAKKLGIPCSNGLPMLVAQAKMASELFTGTKIKDDRIDDITKEIETDTMNIVLIGMPGVGKTTVGKAISSITGREFVDTDDVIVERAGKSIPEIFSSVGESEFRKLEHEVICDVCKKSGLVIATGGGAPTFANNVDPIKQNSRVVFLDRDDILNLDTSGRPISQSRKLDELYKERLPKYRACADMELKCMDGAEANAIAIIYGLK